MAQGKTVHALRKFTPISAKKTFNKYVLPMMIYKKNRPLNKKINPDVYQAFPKLLYMSGFVRLINKLATMSTKTNEYERI